MYSCVRTGAYYPCCPPASYLCPSGASLRAGAYYPTMHTGAYYPCCRLRPGAPASYLCPSRAALRTGAPTSRTGAHYYSCACLLLALLAFLLPTPH